MKKFDYKTISYTLPSGITGMEADLKKLGKDGWELVAVCPSDSYGSGIAEVTAILKKELS